MKNGNLKYIRKYYYLASSTERIDIRDYRIKYKIKETPGLFTDIVRIEKDNGYHDRSRYFDYWLYFRNETNWKRCSKTGLAKTEFETIFEGNISEPVILRSKTKKGKDWENPKHFVIIQFSPDKKTLIVDLFKDFYPHKKELIKNIIKEHSFVYQANI